MQRAPSLRKPRSDVRLSARHLGTRFLWKDTKIRLKAVVGMHRNHLATCSLPQSLYAKPIPTDQSLIWWLLLLLLSYCCIVTRKLFFCDFFVSIRACFSVLLVLPWCCCCRRMLCQLFHRCGSACWSVTLNTRFRFLEDGPRPTRVRSFIGRAGSAAALSQPYRHTGKHPKLERRRR